MNEWISGVRRRRAVSVIGVVLLATVGVWAWPKALSQRAPELLPGVTVRGTVPVLTGESGGVTYSFNVTDETYLVELVISNAPADLDLFVTDRRGETIAVAESMDFNERLIVSRAGDARLETGWYDVEVAYQYTNPPVVDGRTLTEIPFELAARYVNPRVERTLRPGERVEGTLRPEMGMVALFQVEVPTGTQALRFDISNTDGDVDLFVNPSRTALSPAANAHRAQSVRSTEVLILDRTSNPPLRPLTYSVLVMDQLGGNYPVDFTLSVSASRNAPEHLLAIPALPDPNSDLDRALLATVELLTYGSGGSGVVVDPRGYILTNWHVVRGDSGGPAADITVGVSIDHARPPAELFTAEVVEFDTQRDLALLRITGGRYGQALPQSIQFPWVPMIGSDAPGEGPGMGDPLHVIGYPSIGGTESRVSVTYTRGIVAGFQRVPFATLIKTDAEINDGNSGGAALNDRFQLVGLPTQVVGLDAGQIAYIVPVHALPAHWLRHLER